MCLCFPKAAGTQVAQAGTGSVPCLDQAAPASPRLELSFLQSMWRKVGWDRLWGWHLSAHGDRKLPWERKCHTCRAKSSSLGVTRTYSVPEESFSGLCSGIRSPGGIRTRNSPPRWSPRSPHTHPWCWTWSSAPTASSAASAACGALPCQAVPRPGFPPLGARPALQQRKGLSE